MDHSQFNIVSPQFKANPFPLVANLRASQPVFRTALPDKTPVWLLTRYQDVAILLKDELQGEGFVSIRLRIRSRVL